MRTSAALRCAMLFAFLGCVFAPAAAAQNARTVIVLVRHAEKEAEPAADPVLTSAGEARARDLARRLADAGVDAIYASQFKRTILTGEPLAKALGLEVKIAPINGGAEAYAAALARTILEQHAGQTVVVVNHSNTVPLIARALGAPDPGAIDESEYGHLLIVIAGPGGTRELIRAHY